MALMDATICRGILRNGPDGSFLEGENGHSCLEGERLWSGYLAHFADRRVCARRLPQIDYETGRPMIIMWPDVPAPPEPRCELYFNERLVKYPASFLGHMAINVSGEIFNFSHKINENEAMRPEEYFYRPALGEFAPHPQTFRDNTDDPQKPYYDKFGRLFMRTIHVLRIAGPDTEALARYYHRELDRIHAAPPDPKRPDAYADFNLFTRSCSTIIRDGLRAAGYTKISGIFPRDLFVNAAYFFLTQPPASCIRAQRFSLRQLSVPEAAPSVMPPLLNPVNLYKNSRLPRSFPASQER
ncbi:MAG: hypothetical protein PHG54_12745 [Smithellaceae bacterium]|nr:hypothetical protein [Smithellaceae bacterium]NLX52887.1 hypothetical protein [Deltaproteobacteria bacterium]